MVQKQTQANDFLYAVFMVIVVAFIGYYAVIGYVSSTNTKLQYDFETIAQDNIAFASLGEKNALLLEVQDNSTIYSIVEENLSFSNNIDKINTNFSELDDYSILFSYEMSVAGDRDNEELRIDSAPINDKNVTNVLAHSIEYDYSEQQYVVEVNGVDLVFIQEFDINTTKGFDFIYDVDESSGFVSVEVLRVDLEDEKSIVYRQSSTLDTELRELDLVYGQEFWTNILMLGNEDTTSIKVNEVSFTY